MKAADPVADWSPPSDKLVAAARAFLAPWRWVTQPCFLHAERVPTRPVMFISNHTLMGMLDTPLLMLGIYQHTGHFPRSMGDNFHFTVPGWRDMLSAFGAVPGSRDNCRALMREGHSLIIFPGGAREVFKGKGQQYTLIWGKRAGFARMAREHGYAVVPVASVGAEECYRIVLDADEIAQTRIGGAIADKSPRKDVALPPLLRGFGGSLLPIPQRFYFMFGEPIDSRPYMDREDEDEAIFELREEVRGALEALLDELLGLRERDPRRSLKARIRSSIGLSPS